MRKAFVSLIVSFLLAPVSAQAQVGDFEAMAGACDAFLADGRFPPATAEAAFFLDRGFKGAAMTARDGEVSRSYTRSGTPVDPVRIMVARPTETGGESCSVLDLSGPEAGDSFIVKTRAERSWTFDSESDDVNGKGVLFERSVATNMIFLSIWGTGGAYPVSIASYQIGTSD